MSFTPDPSVSEVRRTTRLFTAGEREPWNLITFTSLEAGGAKETVAPLFLPLFSAPVH